VKSFKIEGRLKGPEYVAITTRAYRLAVDAAWQALHTPQEGDPIQGTATAVAGAGAVGGAVAATGAATGAVTGAVGNAASKHSSSVSGKGDLEGVRALKKKIASTSTSATSSDRFNGVDDALMRDLKQVFARGQDQDYDGLSAGSTHTHTHTHTHTYIAHTHIHSTHSHTHTHTHSHSRSTHTYYTILSSTTLHAPQGF
jgi:hypothetical protein